MIIVFPKPVEKLQARNQKAESTQSKGKVDCVHEALVKCETKTGQTGQLATV